MYNAIYSNIPLDFYIYIDCILPLSNIAVKNINSSAQSPAKMHPTSKHLFYGA